MIVTVVTPTLNGREYLRECIESVRHNESAGIEVEHLIVDGGSTDGTVELAGAYGLRVLQGTDRGIFDAINKGSFNSSGELLGFLGADDVMLEGGVKRIVDAYRRGKRRWVVGGIWWIDELGCRRGGLAAPPSWMTPRMIVCLDWNPIMHMATYVSRELFIELNGFNIEYKDAGDFEMFMRALAREPYERVAAPIACFRQTGKNNSAVNRERTRREQGVTRNKFGPKSELERACWRYALKIWFNLSNPSWLVDKTASAIGARIGNARRSGTVL